ncbi:hypothetical protein XM38_049320 [Halomicronema hongdechloris C2206]|uniref:PsbP C-terminal domain-containing protein n=1 Tax=Halomicronema hongdechloris C2206 TaxID=1641165 RepID=A0A1Z3HUG4_9CYAN|nr:hypothetical protein [Halomicronema hongdechloris]ASC73958.1 hypothetical protein XM38_049320 [Halomicronema hongdechloris C2206]
MMARSLLMMTLVGIGLMATMPILAGLDRPSVAADQSTGNDAADSGSPELQTHVEPGQFQLRFPLAWQVEQHQDGSISITNHGTDDPERASQATDVLTEVRLVQEHPQDYVPQAIETIAENGYQVIHYRPVVVDERSALRLWMAELPDDLANAMTTYVGYASYGTAVITSYYGEPTAEGEALIEQVHDSFQLVFD